METGPNQRCCSKANSSKGGRNTSSMLTRKAGWIYFGDWLLKVRPDLEGDQLLFIASLGQFLAQNILSFAYSQCKIFPAGQEAYMHMQSPEPALIFLSFSVEINIPGSLDVLKCICGVLWLPSPYNASLRYWRSWKIDRIIGLVISVEFYNSGAAIFNSLKSPVLQNLSRSTAGVHTSNKDVGCSSNLLDAHLLEVG
ncbi:hypothetical protein CR513_60145, partial [Mucuna pruriens]